MHFLLAETINGENSSGIVGSFAENSLGFAVMAAKNIFPRGPQ